MVGAEVARRLKIVNHSAHEPSGLAFAGRSPDGSPVLLNREWLQADRRVVVKPEYGYNLARMPFESSSRQAL